MVKGLINRYHQGYRIQSVMRIVPDDISYIAMDVCVARTIKLNCFVDHFKVQLHLYLCLQIPVFLQDFMSHFLI